MEDVKNEPASKSVLVCGDLIIDNHIYAGKRKHASMRKASGTEIVKTLGGANLTYNLIKALRDHQDKTERWFNAGRAFNTIMEKHPEDQSFAVWETDDEGNYVFRKALGYGEWKTNNKLDYESLKTDTRKTDILVIDDGGTGFRDDGAVDKLPGSGFIVLKTVEPLFTGKLWKKLMADHKSRLITLLSIHELRKYDIKVSKGISWEQTCLDLCYELVYHPLLKKLLESKYLVISIGMEGAVIIKDGSDREKAEFSLVFDPEFMENEWEDNRKVRGIGRMCAFTAGFTYRLAQNDQDLMQVETNDLVRCAKLGIAYQRQLMKIKDKWPGTQEAYRQKPFSGFKEQLVLTGGSEKGFIDPVFRFSDAFIPSPYWYDKPMHYLREGQWSIFLNNYDHHRETGRAMPKEYFENITLIAAKRAAIQGIDTLKHVPFLQLNKLFTIERKEIENLRNVRKLILQYIGGRRKRPFNLAVFGPPGTGKSFIVKEIAHSVINGNEMAFDRQASFLTFNLSQFRQDSELIGAFHLVRDEVLKGKLPFVFWDEFDTGNLKWLQYFLAPMQDGVFQDGKDIHPIGKCIFIFAGSTVNNMQSFEPENPLSYGAWAPKENDRVTRQRMKRMQRKYDDFKARKGTDFKSRLNAFINVSGPNRRKVCKKGEWRDDPDDMMVPVRRALFIRTCLEMKEKEKLKMDPGLVTAFLKTDRYKHGSRSLSRILDHLKNDPEGWISRSDLPSDEIMNLHLDFDRFIGIANDDKNREISFPIEELAQEIHLTWMEIVKEHDEENIFRREYMILPEDIKYDNVKAAERLMKMLIDEGFEVVREEDPRPSAIQEFENKYIGNKKILEALAEKEHNDWVSAREKAGWRYGENRSDYLKEHPNMDPDKRYEDFAEKEKRKDRDTITKIPETIKKTKYKIVKKDIL